MKYYYALIIFLSLILLSGCGDDEILTGDRPTISVTAATSSGNTLLDGGNIIASDSVEFRINVSAPAGFNSILIGGSTNTVLTKADAGVGDGALEINDIAYKISTDSDDGGARATYIFVALDDLGQRSDSIRFSFDIDPVVDLHSNVVLGGFENSSAGSFCDAINNTIFFTANSVANAAQIDLIFYHQNSVGYTLAATDDTDADAAIESQTATGDLDNLNPQNQTRFKTFTNAPNFNDIVSITSLENAYSSNSSATGLTDINGLSANSIIGFQIDSSRGSRIGLIRIVETTGTTGTTRAIRLDIKIEP